jgi:hypothetical protein
MPALSSDQPAASVSPGRLMTTVLFIRGAGTGEKKLKKTKYRLRYKNIDYICIVYDKIVTDIKSQILSARKQQPKQQTRKTEYYGKEFLPVQSEESPGQGDKHGRVQWQGCSCSKHRE